MWKIILIGLLFLPLTTFGSTYSSNFLTGGTCSASSEHAIGPCENAFDENTATRWGVLDAQAGVYPHWVEIDLGEGNDEKMNKSILKVYNDDTYQYLKDFEIWGSNDDWTSSSTVYVGQTSGTSHDVNNVSTNEFIFDSSTSTAFRYNRLQVTSDWDPANTTWVWDWYGYTCTDCETQESSSTATSSIEELKSQAQTNLYVILFYVIEFAVVSLVAWFSWKGIKKLFRLK
jgi:hypothetical protein